MLDWRSSLKDDLVFAFFSLPMSRKYQRQQAAPSLHCLLRDPRMVYRPGVVLYWPNSLLILTHQADQNPLDLYAIGVEDPGLIRGIGRF